MLAATHNDRRVRQRREEGGASARVAQLGFSGYDSTGPAYLPHRHQVALVDAMRDMEEKRDAGAGDDEAGTRYKLAVLSSMAGSGKTLVVLLHAAARPLLSQKTTTLKETQLFGGLATEMTPIPHRFCLDGTLIIIPSSLWPQWMAEAEKMAGLLQLPEDLALYKRFGFAEYNDLAHRSRKADAPLPVASPRVVIMTSKAYEDFMRLKGAAGYVDAHRDFIFQRVAIDEADTIQVRNFAFPNAHFTWLVTATARRLVENDVCTSGLRLSAHGQASAQAWARLTVSCTPEYIYESMGHLPRPIHRVAHVKRGALLDALCSVSPRAVREALEAGDVSGAIMATGCSTVSSQQGLVAAATEHLYDEIDKTLEAMGDAGMARVRDLEHSINTIGARVREADGVCPITMDNIRIPAMTRCCQNTFEWEALDQAMRAHPACPLCRRSPFLASDIVVEMSRSPAPPPTADGSLENPHRDIQEALCAELRRVFQERPDAKVIVFSEHGMCEGVHGSRTVSSTVSDAVGHVCDHAVLKGSSQVNKILRVMKSGGAIRAQAPATKRLGVLLLDARHLGAGHNMEFATHVITLHDMEPELYHQVIGRAQRMGRTQPLEIVDIRMDVS